MVWTRDGLILVGQRIHGIVYGIALTRILMILVDDRLTRQLRHTHDAVGIVHTVLLDTVNGRIHLTTRTVEVGSMNMDAQRFTTDLLGMDAGRIGQPVVSMDNVVVQGTSHHASDNRIVIDFLMQIARITTGKFHSAQVVDMHVVEVGIQMVAQTEIQVRIHDITHSLTDIVGRHVTIGNRHSIHGHNLASRTILVTEGMRQTERNIHIALSIKALRDTIVGGGQSTEYVRRILPSKH